MKYPVHNIAETLISILETQGITRAVVSPGSRNSTLLCALSQSEIINSEVVIDERSAGFIALGISISIRKPVVLICTSGTALLNYAPAVAEAYYRHIPLIVISADRPAEWIDQDDSQTIRQYEALNNFVKHSYNIPVIDTDSDQWFGNRIINDAILTSIQQSPGPVHINIQIGTLGLSTTRIPANERIISSISPHSTLSPYNITRICKALASPKKVMIIAGFMQSDPLLNNALNQLSQLSNIVVLTETISNLNGKYFIEAIDSTLSMLPDNDADYIPDIVISFGGAIVSRHIKDFLRRQNSVQHWHVGTSENAIDCFLSLTTRIHLDPTEFFCRLSSIKQYETHESNFSNRWLILKDKAISYRQAFVANSEWCDLKAYAILLPLIPRRWNVHFSNGTPIRYSMLFGEHKYHSCHCNRGVSGIDGCTSTAIGASIDYNDVTLLITGDMSAQYDIGAFAFKPMPTRFKMIVFCNGGGGIFRFIRATDQLPILDDYLCTDMHIPLKQLARGYGFNYWEADSIDSLRNTFAEFSSATDKPSILCVKTDGKLSAQYLKKYFNHK